MRTDQESDNSIRIKMAGKVLHYTPTPSWNFDKTSLRRWLSESLMESKNLTFKMLRVKTGFSVEDPDLPTTVDAPLEPITEDTSANNGVEGDDPSLSDDEIESVVPRRHRPRPRPNKRGTRTTNSITSHRAPPNSGRRNQRAPWHRSQDRGQYRPPAGPSNARNNRRSGQPSRGYSRAPRRQSQGRNTRRGPTRAPEPAAPTAPVPAQPAPPAPAPAAYQAALPSFIPVPFPMMGYQGLQSGAPLQFWPRTGF